MIYKTMIILITALLLLGCSFDNPKPAYKHDYTQSDKAHDELNSVNKRY